MKPPVLTKADFVRRFSRNEFGNRGPMWDTYHEFICAHYESGLVHIRNRIAGGETWYDIPSSEVGPKVLEILAQGKYKIEDLYYAAMAPTSQTLFQGEVRRSTRHLDLYYSTVPKPMRQSLLEGGTQVYGATARVLLKHYLDGNSYDWLCHLLNSYSDHVVEFSTYSCNWGTIPRMNTVYWECRKY